MPTQPFQLHLIIQGFTQCGDGDDNNSAEVAPYRTHEARQLVIADAHSGSVTALDDNEQNLWRDGLVMNVHHAFECPAGAFLLIGLGQRTKNPKGWAECKQQLLLYQAGGMPHAGDNSQTNLAF